MFYAHIVLAKKGPLARIWLAAHWDKKLTKAHVFETNIEQSVEGIMQPKVKLALRTSGHLLLGVVRIYSRKAKYLLADCNEAFVKIKMAFRPGMVDLPEEHREAAVNAITLPEVFHDFDTALPELNDVDIEAQFSINQSRADEITMREDYSNYHMPMNDDGFGDLGFDGSDFIRDGGVDDNMMSDGLQIGQDDEDTTLKEPGASTSRSLMDVDGQPLVGDSYGEPGFGTEPVGLFEGELFADADADADTTMIPQSSMHQNEHDSDDDVPGGWDDGGHSPCSNGSDAASPIHAGTSQGLDDTLVPGIDGVTSAGKGLSDSLAVDLDESELAPRVDDETGLDGPDAELENEREEESFALAPIDATALRGMTKSKRKRKLIVDEIKNISGEEMKSQLANTADIITTLDLAPPTKRLMYWKETGGVEKLFALPSRDISARGLFKNYQRNIASRPSPIEDFSILGPADVLALDQYQEQQPLAQTQVAEVAATPSRRGRKRKLPLPEADSTLNESVIVPRAGGIDAELSLMSGPQLDNLDRRLEPPMEISSFDTPSIDMVPVDPSVIDPPLNNLSLSSMTPAGVHGDYSTHPVIDQLDTEIPNLPADTVSKILNGASDGYANMGYDDGNPSSGRMSERIENDWNDDYDFPPSVGAHQPGDEQMENETDEQFEERVLNKRAAQMFVAVRSKMQKHDTIYLSEMTYRNNRKQAAQKFYSLLVLKKFQALDLRQEDTYGDILVSKGVMFDNPKL